MSDELQHTMKMLASLKKQFDDVIPAVAKKITEAPEIQQIVEISQKARRTIPVALERISEFTAPYTELVKQFTVKITPHLLQLAKVSARLSVIDRIGKVQYVSWTGFPEAFYEQAYAVQTERGLLELLLDWQVERNYLEVEKTIKLLSENEHLKENHMFAQAVAAYRRAEYDIAALGFTATVDRLLSVYTGMIDSTSIGNRVKVIKEKVDIEGDSVLDDFEMNDYILISTYSSAIELFGAHSNFAKDEPDLNRHWIAHGRIERKIEQIDCIRLINILYGTILMGHWKRTEERGDSEVY